MNGMRTLSVCPRCRPSKDLVGSGVVITGSRHVYQHKTALAARSLTDAVGGRTILASCLFGSHLSTNGTFL